MVATHSTSTLVPAIRNKLRKHEHARQPLASLLPLDRAAAAAGMSSSVRFPNVSETGLPRVESSLHFLKRFAEYASPYRTRFAVIYNLILYWLSIWCAALISLNLHGMPF